jgi:hypothetical protein
MKSEIDENGVVQMRVLQWALLSFAVLNVGCAPVESGEGSSLGRPELFVHRAKAANALGALQGVVQMGYTWLASAPMPAVPDMDEVETTSAPPAYTYSQIFDSRVYNNDFYVSIYPDLQAAFGANYAALQNHWATYGVREGRIASPIFDSGYYVNTQTDLALAANYGTECYVQAIIHFVNAGIAEGRQGSRVFWAARYIAFNPGLGLTTPAAAVAHYRDYGQYEARFTSNEWDPMWYLKQNPDVAAAYGATNYYGALKHWVMWGFGESRRGAFDVNHLLLLLKRQ